MQVKVARHAGFCFGVERAIDIVKKASEENNNVVTFGPIIHNPQVVSDLESKGVSTIKSLDEVDAGMSVVIRSHGIEKQEALYLEKNAGKVIDAACPFVQKGEADHPEVKGIISYIDIDYKVIENINEIDDLEFKEKYGFLAQTTQNQDVFKEIENMLKSKCNELVVAKTICSATEHRQSAAIEVASNVEVMIVVGGKNSANTTRLYHLCKEICPKTYHVETEKELNADMFLNVENVGLTAGASTPKYLLEKVREYIYEVAR